jgi:hypothetical protein
MKLRLRGDSIRIRLRQHQLQQLLNSGAVSETTTFGPHSELKCILAVGGNQVSTTFQSGELKVLIPHGQIQQWATTDQVGITADQPIGDGRMLRILIEKDFACRDGASDESQEGAFENPAGTKC